MKKFFIDYYEIKHWAQGYTLSVNSMRPSNAPKFRITQADMDRQSYVSKINYDLAMSGRYFKDLNEIKDFIDELNK